MRLTVLFLVSEIVHVRRYLAGLTPLKAPAGETSSYLLTLLTSARGSLYEGTEVPLCIGL